MSSESPSATSGPPHASSWAAPPEFYIDENVAGRTLRQAITALGYVVHTPAQIFGAEALADGVRDEAWLREVGRHGWAVIGRDTKILQRPDEAAAYRAAKVHMFLFPGQATRSALVDLLSANLAAICTEWSRSEPGAFLVHATGLRRL
ncbi:MAG: hypothetical protein ACT4QG_06370 [Sporichthyaceae bacterium]